MHLRLRPSSLSFPIPVLALIVSGVSLACDSIDSKFERMGQIVSTNTVSSDSLARIPKIGELEYLEGLLDAFPA